MRCLVKCLSMFGLGLYIYRGEDVPSTDTEQVQPVQPAKPVEKVVQLQTTAQKPVKDIRPATAEMVDIIRKAVREHGVIEDFICESYKICKLEDLRIYQFNHIKQNIEKLKTMFDEERKKRLADVVKNAKPAKMKTTFGDAICQPQQQQQEKNESEEVTLESLGLTEADLNILAEAGNIFS